MESSNDAHGHSEEECLTSKRTSIAWRDVASITGMILCFLTVGISYATMAPFFPLEVITPPHAFSKRLLTRQSHGFYLFVTGDTEIDLVYANGDSVCILRTHSILDQFCLSASHTVPWNQAFGVYRQHLTGYRSTGVFLRNICPCGNSILHCVYRVSYPVGHREFSG